MGHKVSLKRRVIYGMDSVKKNVIFQENHSTLWSPSTSYCLQDEEPENDEILVDSRFSSLTKNE